MTGTVHTRVISFVFPYSNPNSAADSTPVGPAPPTTIVFAAFTCSCVLCNAFLVTSYPSIEDFHGTSSFDLHPVAMTRISYCCVCSPEGVLIVIVLVIVSTPDAAPSMNTADSLYCAKPSGILWKTLGDCQV